MNLTLEYDLFDPRAEAAGFFTAHNGEEYINVATQNAFRGWQFARALTADWQAERSRLLAEIEDLKGLANTAEKWRGIAEARGREPVDEARERALFEASQAARDFSLTVDSYGDYEDYATRSALRVWREARAQLVASETGPAEGAPPKNEMERLAQSFGIDAVEEAVMEQASVFARAYARSLAVGLPDDKAAEIEARSDLRSMVRDALATPTAQSKPQEDA